MLGTKLKLTDLKTGQEWLLLVTRMNMKGLLVQAAQTLASGTPVHLSLQLEEGRRSLELRGEVYRIAERAEGQKGMIIRFVDPPREVLDRIAGYIAVREQEAPDAGESQEYPDSPEAKTMMVSKEQDTLSLLTFTQPRFKDGDAEPFATVDEEEEQKKVLSFLEETRVVPPTEMDSFVRKAKGRPRLGRYRWALLLLLVPAGFWGARTLIARLPSPEVIRPATTPAKFTPNPVQALKEPSPERPAAAVATVAPAPEEIHPTPAPARTPAPKPELPEIKAISVEETPAFLKISIGGTALKIPEVNRMMNPRRFMLDFAEAKKVSVESSIAVGVNPLLRIRTVKQGTGFQVILDLYPVEFPRYDVKDQPGGLGVYLYR
jgi:hypothetical protein